MAVSRIDVAVLREGLTSYGFEVFGSFVLEAQHCIANHDEYLGRQAILVGNIGSRIWLHFSQSAEYQDSEPDPLNRYTARILGGVARAQEIEAIFPFDEPYWPFQRFAASALGVQSSPLGMQIHPEFGLWYGLRGAFILPEDTELVGDVDGVSVAQTHPCDTCVDKPCLNTCPVSAFTINGYNTEACYGHLDRGEDPDCRSLGCLARDACPVGKEYRYEPQHIRFHMDRVGR